MSNHAPLFTDAFALCEWLLQHLDQEPGVLARSLCKDALRLLDAITFAGPAALAKLYRFLTDSREQRDGTTLEQEDAHEGVWGCHTITRCIDACPKGVRPTDGIEGARRKLLVHKFKKLIGQSK